MIWSGDIGRKPYKKGKIMMDIAGWGIAASLIILTVAMHYETMRFVSDAVLPWAFRRFHNRRIMMVLIMTLILGHISEIWMFALAMFAMNFNPALGYLTGTFDGPLGFNIFVYFSAANYTSLGYGDIMPHGALRNVSVSEALAGLLMIAWSASFTYLKMEQIWNLRRREPHHDGHHHL